MAVRLYVAQHPRQLDELVDLLRALLARQPFPARRELTAVERLAVGAALLQPADVRGVAAGEDGQAQAAQLELARGRAEHLARLVEHLVDERARFVVDQPAAPSPLVPS